MHVNTAIRLVRCIYRCIDLCSIHNSSPSSSQRPELAKPATNLQWQHCLHSTKCSRQVYRLAYIQLRTNYQMSCTLWLYIAPLCKSRILSIYDTENIQKIGLSGTATTLLLGTAKELLHTSNLAAESEPLTHCRKSVRSGLSGCESNLSSFAQQASIWHYYLPCSAPEMDVRSVVCPLVTRATQCLLAQPSGC